MNKYTKLTALAFAASLAFAATSAHATNGVLEINQACATAPGGCFAGDTQGFPVTITKAGSYRLTSNLDNSDKTKNTIRIGHGVTEGNVTLDLNGFSVIGACKGTAPASCAASSTDYNHGVSILGSAHIKNGSITHAEDSGIVAAFSQVKVSNVTFTQNRVHGIEGALTYLSVSDSIFDQNGSSGINGNGPSTTVSRRSQFISNGAAGQVNGACQDNTFTGNNGSGAEETCQIFIGTNVCDNAVCP